MHQVMNGAAFAKKFGVTNDVKLRAATVVTFDCFGDTLSCFHRHGTFVDNYSIVGEHVCDLAGNLFDEAKINLSVRLRRGGNCDENDLGIVDSFTNAAAEAQTVGRDVAMDDLLQPGLINRDPAGLEGFDFFFIVVDANDIVSDVGEAGAGNETYIAGADD